MRLQIPQVVGHASECVGNAVRDLKSIVIEFPNNIESQAVELSKTVMNDSIIT